MPSAFLICRVSKTNSDPTKDKKGCAKKNDIVKFYPYSQCVENPSSNFYAILKVSDMDDTEGKLYDIPSYLYIAFWGDSGCESTLGSNIIDTNANTHGLSIGDKITVSAGFLNSELYIIGLANKAITVSENATSSEYPVDVTRSAYEKIDRFCRYKIEVDDLTQQQQDDIDSKIIVELTRAEFLSALEDKDA